LPQDRFISQPVENERYYKWNSCSLYYTTENNLIHKELVLLYFRNRTEFETFMGDEVDSREIDHSFIEWNVKEKSNDFYNLWEILKERTSSNNSMDEALKYLGSQAFLNLS